MQVGPKFVPKIDHQRFHFIVLIHWNKSEARNSITYCFQFILVQLKLGFNSNYSLFGSQSDSYIRILNERVLAVEEEEEEKWCLFHLIFATSGDRAFFPPGGS